MKTKKKKAQTKPVSIVASSAKTRSVPMFPYFTRDLLIEASRLGRKWNYNRQISEQIAEVPDLKYHVVFHMFHYHRRFKPCEMHVRCMISLEPFKKTFVFCDMPVEFFKKLPRITRRSNKMARLAVA